MYITGVNKFREDRIRKEQEKVDTKEEVKEWVTQIEKEQTTLDNQTPHLGSTGGLKPIIPELMNMIGTHNDRVRYTQAKLKRPKSTGKSCRFPRKQIGPAVTQMTSTCYGKSTVGF